MVCIYISAQALLEEDERRTRDIKWLTDHLDINIEIVRVANATSPCSHNDDGQTLGFDLIYTVCYINVQIRGMGDDGHNSRMGYWYACLLITRNFCDSADTLLASAHTLALAFACRYV